ncbi:DNA polymerase III subunit gamma/tau [Candidatus Saccharibacteria bacterium]|nr:DNA polymerase III subunit gamma/tau [Candidatus Saccharibacteria bacterium]
MKALYRRYRPMTLAEVVGQPQVTEPLINSLKSGKINHAYLFIGPRGTGKTSVARIFAHEVNGFPYEIEDDYVDIIEIDGASNRGIDNIRELREKVAIAPTSGKYKVYIIDEVHMLTKEAFNALLKTLEEPPKHVIFIMATTDAYKVPVTITSRAQTYTFGLADSKTMFEHLKSICEKEKIKIADDALKIIVKRGGGSFRDSLSLLDQISTLTSEEITKEIVENAMGLPEDEKILALLDSYKSGDITQITNLLKELLSSGVRPETLAEEMIATIIDNPQPELLKLLASLPDVRAPFAEAKLLVALCSDGIKETSSPPRAISAQPSVVAPQAPAHQDSSAAINTPVSHTPSNFDWNSFLETVRGMNDAVYSQVAKASYVVNGNKLNIYPNKKIAKTILSRDNNKKILIDAAGGMKVAIGEVGENPNAPKDELISKISDIMGGEVHNDGGGNPF